MAETSGAAVRHAQRQHAGQEHAVRQPVDDMQRGRGGRSGGEEPHGAHGLGIDEDGAVPVRNNVLIVEVAGLQQIGQKQQLTEARVVGAGLLGAGERQSTDLLGPGVAPRSE